MNPKAKRLTTTEQCDALEMNATAGGDLELAADATKRSLQIRAAAHGEVGSVESECLQAIYAYERARSLSPGKRFRATRTWQMIQRRGVIPAVEHIVTKSDTTMGFATLIEAGLSDHAFEAVVLRHPESFSPEAVDISRQRLARPDKR
jgi:hypothetical protein